MAHLRLCTLVKDNYQAALPPNVPGGLPLAVVEGEVLDGAAGDPGALGEAQVGQPGQAHRHLGV